MVPKFISILIILFLLNFVRSDVKMNSFFKLLSPEGKKCNFFFSSDLVLSIDESMNQVMCGIA